MTATQLALPAGPEGWFQPVPLGLRGYVPVLQNHAGELDALRNIHPNLWPHVTPLVEFVGPKTPKESLTHTQIAGWVKRACDALGDHACWLDTLRLEPTQPVENPGKPSVPVIAAILAAARSRRMNFVPVARPGQPPRISSIIRDAIDADDRGVAVRHRFLDFIPALGQTHATLLARLLDELHVEATCADLILDADYLTGDVDVEPVDIDLVMHEAIAVGKWRNIILVGTSMPKALGGGIVPEGTLGRLPRREWQLWKAIRSSGSPRLPVYGDYAIQHPHPAAVGEASGPGMRRNIRYTSADETLIPRAVGSAVQESDEQYRELCQWIIDESDYSGDSYSWGDEAIADCATGSGPPGSQRRWRGAGTSHHIRFVIEQLVARAGAE